MKLHHELVDSLLSDGHGVPVYSCSRCGARRDYGSSRYFRLVHRRMTNSPPHFEELCVSDDCNEEIVRQVLES